MLTLIRFLVPLVEPLGELGDLARRILKCVFLLVELLGSRGFGVVGRLESGEYVGVGCHECFLPLAFFAAFLRATDNAIATACFCGFPAAISVLMLDDTADLLLPGFRGMLVSRRKKIWVDPVFALLNPA